MTDTHPLLHDRAALARAITLIESTRADHQKQAQSLLAEILPKTGQSIRVGISGVPGVGKSTFIESFGMFAIAQGHKVAVLAIDPSSSKTGGSILGDKTRMSQLAQHESAFIRPTPTSGMLGGVARRTREVMLLCEAAGYDIILVETVGVGQSEIEVADMVDLFLLLLLPGSGDELQGIKKGIVELADILIVNKADGDMKPQADRVRADYTAAMRMLHARDSGGTPSVLTSSALTGDGLPEVWAAVGAMMRARLENGAMHERRTQQSQAWMWKEIREQLVGRFLDHAQVSARIHHVETEVANGNITPTAAASQLIDLFKL